MIFYRFEFIIKMSLSLEIIHKNTIDKFKNLEVLLNRISKSLGHETIAVFPDNDMLSNYEDKTSGNKDLDDIKDYIKKLIEDYNISIIQPLSDFYNNKPNAEQSYNESITSYNIDGRYMTSIDKCKDFLLKLKMNKVIEQETYNEITIDINYILNNKINLSSKPVNYEFCCNQKMTVLAERSELYCEICKTPTVIKGMVFNDAQFYCQDSKKSKHGKYDVLRNFNTWIDHIYATDGFEIPKEMRIDIEKFLEREKLGEFGRSDRINILDVRNFLEQYNYSKYNKNGSSILSQISGEHPPHLSTEDHDMLINIFNQIITILNDTLNPKYSDIPKSKNTPYCPYFIAKIVEAKWVNDLEKQRIHSYIFHKKPETVNELDNKWYYLCPHLGFKFKSTDVTIIPERPKEGKLRVQESLKKNKKNNSSEMLINYI